MLKIGIVGLPNVGKSTLFRALTKKEVHIENYPFVTIDPNIGVVEVPDPRVDALSSLSHSKKKVYAIVEFVDIAGIVKGAAEGQGLGNKFLAHIKEVDAIAEVIRVFENGDIIHVSGTVAPERDIDIIDIELAMKDLETVEARLPAAEKRIKAGEKAAAAEKELLVALAAGLKRGERASEILAGAGVERERAECKTLLNELSLLTAKPRIFVFNGSEEQVARAWRPPAPIMEKIGNAPWVLISAKIEDELNSLSQEEKAEYLRELGVAASGLDQLIRAGYRALDLITFLTTGEDETRAWTIPRGSPAPRAGRAIHSDFEEKFIRAEVIPYAQLVAAGSFAAAKERGWVKIEGREYTVTDGDVIEFKI